MKETVFAQNHAVSGGLLQSLDPRMKLVTFFAMIVSVSFIKHPAHLLFVYVLTLALAAMSRIPIPFFVKRVWFFIPIFSAVIALPALILVPGKPIAHLFTLAGHDISITSQGLDSSLLFVLRVASSVSLAILLTLTTKWTQLLQSLRTIRVPSIFVLILGLTYRYIFHILDQVLETYEARLSRTISRQSAAKERGWIAGRAGHTLIHAMKTGDGVYEAMASRGFTGDPVFYSEHVSGIGDILFVFTAAAVIILIAVFGGFV